MSGGVLAADERDRAQHSDPAAGARAAEPRASSRGVVCGGLEGVVRQRLTVARVAEGFGVAWNTANDAVQTEGKRGSDRRSAPARRRPGSRRRLSALEAHPARRDVRHRDHGPYTLLGHAFRDGQVVFFRLDRYASLANSGTRLRPIHSNANGEPVCMAIASASAMK